MILKFMDDFTEKIISNWFYVLSSVYLVNQIAFLVLIFNFYYIGFGVTVLACLLFLIYLLVQYYILNKNDFVENTFFKIANPMLLIGVICGVIGFATYTDKLYGVAAWSICILLILLIFLTVFTLMWFYDKSQQMYRPVSYSPYIFPVFKYNPKNNQLVNHPVPAIIMIMIIILAFIWAFGVMLLMKPI
jgi:hypothetical protein